MSSILDIFSKEDVGGRRRIEERVEDCDTGSG